MKYRINVDEYTIWYKNDEWHREYGPAWEWAGGSKEWSIEGKYNRLDGPAVDSVTGYKEWRINDIQYSEEEFKRIISGKK